MKIELDTNELTGVDIANLANILIENYKHLPAHLHQPLIDVICGKVELVDDINDYKGKTFNGANSRMIYYEHLELCLIFTREVHFLTSYYTLQEVYNGLENECLNRWKKYYENI